jgi:hypothetical protein
MTTKQHEHRCAVCNTHWLDGEPDASCPNIECCGDRIEERGPRAKFGCSHCGKTFTAEHSGGINHGVTCECGGIPHMTNLVYDAPLDPAATIDQRGIDDGKLYRVDPETGRVVSPEPTVHCPSCLCLTCCDDFADASLHGRDVDDALGKLAAAPSNGEQLRNFSPTLGNPGIARLSTMADRLNAMPVPKHCDNCHAKYLDNEEHTCGVPRAGDLQSQIDRLRNDLAKLRRDLRFTP